MTTSNVQVHQIWDDIREYAYALKSEGFRVMIPAKEPRTYFYIEKNGILGYVQKDSFFNFGFGTLYYPTLKHGTGFKIYSHVPATIAHAEHLCSRNHSHHSTKPYKSLEEYATVNSWQEYFFI